MTLTYENPSLIHLREREKWKSDVDFRKSDLELKERELEIRRGEQRSLAWRNPLTMAIIGAIATAFINMYVSYENGRLQRELEATKRDAEIELRKNQVRVQPYSGDD